MIARTWPALTSAVIPRSSGRSLHLTVRCVIAFVGLPASVTLTVYTASSKTNWTPPSACAASAPSRFAISTSLEVLTISLHMPSATGALLRMHGAPDRAKWGTARFGGLWGRA